MSSAQQDLDYDSAKTYPNDADQYTLIEEIGMGACSKVYRALCKSTNEEVAVKIIDLERYDANIIEELYKEINIMRSCSHQNVVKYFTSFTCESNLYIVMELLEGGSVYDLLRLSYKEGLDDEDLIGSILKQVLQALHYFHTNGHIHRDVKASNILLDKFGVVRLADFGLAACLMENGDRKKKRLTFVGSPCWMAPEVMEQTHGYDYKADIWSFAITALELCYGRAPYANFPPMKVMYLTLEGPPPTLDIGKKKFTKTLKDVIDSCLQREAAKRPSAAQLLKHKLFQKVLGPEIVKTKLLDGSPSLGLRLIQIKKLMDDEEKARQKMLAASQSSGGLASRRDSGAMLSRPPSSLQSTAPPQSAAVGGNQQQTGSSSNTSNNLSETSDGSESDGSVSSTSGAVRKRPIGWVFNDKKQQQQSAQQPQQQQQQQSSSANNTPIATATNSSTISPQGSSSNIMTSSSSLSSDLASPAIVVNVDANANFSPTPSGVPTPGTASSQHHVSFADLMTAAVANNNSSAGNTPVSAPTVSQQTPAPIQIPANNNAQQAQLLTPPQTKKVITKGRFTVEEIKTPVDDDKNVQQQQQNQQQQQGSVAANNNNAANASGGNNGNAPSSNLVVNTSGHSSGNYHGVHTPLPKHMSNGGSEFAQVEVFDEDDEMSSQMVRTQSLNFVDDDSQELQGSAFDEKLIDSSPEMAALQAQVKRKKMTKRALSIRDVDPNKVPTLRSSVDMAMAQQVPQQQYTQPKQRSKPMSIDKQMNQLMAQSQKQLNILNALYHFSQMQTQFYTKTGKDHSDVFTLMGELEKKIRELTEENANLKRENESLKLDLARSKGEPVVNVANLPPTTPQAAPAQQPEKPQQQANNTVDNPQQQKPPVVPTPAPAPVQQPSQPSAATANPSPTAAVNPPAQQQTGNNNNNNSSNITKSPSVQQLASSGTPMTLQQQKQANALASQQAAAANANQQQPQNTTVIKQAPSQPTSPQPKPDKTRSDEILLDFSSVPEVPAHNAKS